MVHLKNRVILFVHVVILIWANTLVAQDLSISSRIIEFNHDKNLVVRVEITNMESFEIELADELDPKLIFPDRIPVSLFVKGENHSDSRLLFPAVNNPISGIPEDDFSSSILLRPDDTIWFELDLYDDFDLIGILVDNSSYTVGIKLNLKVRAKNSFSQLRRDVELVNIIDPFHIQAIFHRN